MPKRIQRKRTKGWKMPANTVYVGRPTRWGNDWSVGLKHCGCRSVGECQHNGFRCATATEAAAAHRETTEDIIERQGESGRLLRDIRTELGGKDLACWCALDQPCHADVLLRLANP